MWKSIYVPVDNSDHSYVAGKIACLLAQKSGAKVVGSHVYAAKMHDVRFRQMESGLPPEFQDELELERQRDIHDSLITKGLEIITDSYLTLVRMEAAYANVPFEGKSLEGRNWQVLLNDIHESEYDLTCIGALGMAAVKDSVIGSVTERVVRRARRDVLVVKDRVSIPGQIPGEETVGGNGAAEHPKNGSNGSNGVHEKIEYDEKGNPKPIFMANGVELRPAIWEMPPGDIVVAIDGSKYCLGGLKTALWIGQALGKKVHAVSAFDPFFHYAMFHSIAKVLSDEAGKVFRFKEQEKLHEEIIDTGLAKIYQANLDIAKKVAKDDGFEIETTLLAGKPFEKVSEFVRKTKPFLLVVGRIGVHSADDMDIGGNSENLIRGASCNVLVSSRTFTPPDEVVAAETIAWSDDAKKRMMKVPVFARGMAMSAILRFAMEKGYTVITDTVVDKAVGNLLPKGAMAAMKAVGEKIREKEATGQRYNVGEEGGMGKVLSDAMSEVGVNVPVGHSLMGNGNGSNGNGSNGNGHAPEVAVIGNGDTRTRWICKICGYVAKGDKPIRCVVCNVDGDDFLMLPASVSPEVVESQGGVDEHEAYDGVVVKWTSDARKLVNALESSFDRNRSRARIEKTARVRGIQMITKEFAEDVMKESAYSDSVTTSVKAELRAQGEVPSGGYQMPTSSPVATGNGHHGDGMHPGQEATMAAEALQKQRPVEKKDGGDSMEVKLGGLVSQGPSEFTWTADAETRINRVPAGFMRDLTKKHIETIAKKKGVQTVDLALVEEGISGGKEMMATVMSGGKIELPGVSPDRPRPVAANLSGSAADAVHRAGGDIKAAAAAATLPDPPAQTPPKPPAARKTRKFYVCVVCGYVSEGAIPDVCPVCGAGKSKFALQREEVVSEESVPATAPKAAAGSNGHGAPASANAPPLRWSPEAQARVDKVPFSFMKEKVVERIERMARERGKAVIDEDLAEEGLDEGRKNMERALGGSVNFSMFGVKAYEKKPEPAAAEVSVATPVPAAPAEVHPPPSGEGQGEGTRLASVVIGRVWTPSAEVALKALPVSEIRGLAKTGVESLAPAMASGQVDALAFKTAVAAVKGADTAQAGPSPRSWNPEAEAKLDELPYFLLLHFAKVGVERRAANAGRPVSGFVASADVSTSFSTSATPVTDATHLQCPMCGYTLTTAAPDRCPSCHAIERFFVLTPEQKTILTPSSTELLTWTPEAEERMKGVPEGFMRDLTRCRVEKWARRHGYFEITADVVNEKYQSWDAGSKDYKQELTWTEEAQARMSRIPGFVQRTVIKELETEATRRGLTVVDGKLIDEMRAHWEQALNFKMPKPVMEHAKPGTLPQWMGLA